MMGNERYSWGKVFLKAGLRSYVTRVNRGGAEGEGRGIGFGGIFPSKADSTS